MLGTLALAPSEVDTMDLHDVIAAAEGYRRGQEAETARTLLLVNTVRGIMGGDALTMEDVTGRAAARRDPKAAAEAVKARFSKLDWSWSPDFPTPAA